MHFTITYPNDSTAPYLLPRPLLQIRRWWDLSMTGTGRSRNSSLCCTRRHPPQPPRHRWPQCSPVIRPSLQSHSLHLAWHTPFLWWGDYYMYILVSSECTCFALSYVALYVWFCWASSVAQLVEHLSLEHGFESRLRQLIFLRLSWVSCIALGVSWSEYFMHLALYVWFNPASWTLCLTSSVGRASL